MLNSKYIKLFWINNQKISWRNMVRNKWRWLTGLQLRSVPSLHTLTGNRDPLPLAPLKHHYTHHHHHHHDHHPRTNKTHRSLVQSTLLYFIFFALFFIILFSLYTFLYQDHSRLKIQAQLIQAIKFRTLYFHRTWKKKKNAAVLSYIHSSVTEKSRIDFSIFE